MSNYKKTGYLTDDFKYFHICTDGPEEFSYHYHDFHKILIFLKGAVSYFIEGRSFDLLPGDIVLIPAGDIHRPFLDNASSYERIILYIDPCFTSRLSSDSSKENLVSCLFHSSKRRSNVIRISDLYRTRIFALCSLMEEELASQKELQAPFAGKLYQKTLVTELLILLNRASDNLSSIYLENTDKNPLVLSILDYISKNLSGDLSIEHIASVFFISRYHLMHLFKEVTGYTVGNYVTLKRLLYARSLIQKGVPVIEACYMCGYQNYSTFSRAYKKHFHTNARNN